jgi:hypothetical protein
MAPFSDYQQIDNSLFSGLVAGLSSFANSLSEKEKSLDYLKLGDDELHIELVGEIIVAVILAGGESLNSYSVKLMLQFIGQKFLDKYQNKMEDLLFDWENVSEPFNKEIQTFITDQELLNDIKRGQFQNLFTQTISGSLPIELLHWKGIQLLPTSSPDVLEESLKLISSLQEVSPTLIDDVLLESKLNSMLRRLSKDLRFQSTSFDKIPKKLLIQCKDQELFELLNQIFLPNAILPIYCPTFSSLKKIIETWRDPSPYDILIIDEIVSTRKLKILNSIKSLNDDSKIVIVVNKVPRFPRGRYSRRHQFNFIVQKELELNGESPLLDYLQSYFID